MDLGVNLLMFPGYLVGGAIAYAMVGFDHQGFPMVLLISYVATTRLASQWSSLSRTWRPPA